MKNLLNIDDEYHRNLQVINKYLPQGRLIKMAEEYVEMYGGNTQYIYQKMQKVKKGTVVDPEIYLFLIGKVKDLYAIA